GATPRFDSHAAAPQCALPRCAFRLPLIAAVARRGRRQAAGPNRCMVVNGSQVSTVERTQEAEPNAEGEARGKACQARGAEGSPAKLELEVMIAIYMSRRLFTGSTARVSSEGSRL